MEELMYETSKDDVLEEARDYIGDALEDAVDNIMSYAREDASIEGECFVPSVQRKIAAVLRELRDLMVKNIEVEYMLEQPDEDFTMSEGRETWHFSLCDYEGYGFEDVQCRQDMLYLLHILELNKVSLESVHDVGTMNENPTSEFCGIWGTWENDNDVVRTLFEMFPVYEDEKQFLDIVMEDVMYESQNELTPDNLEDLRMYFTSRIDEAYQKFLGEPVVRDCRC